MKRRVLFILIYILILNAFIYAKDTTSSVKKLFFFSYKKNYQLMLDTSQLVFKNIHKNLIKFIDLKEFQPIDSKKVSLKLLPDISIKYKPNLIFEVLGMSAFSLDWKGGGAVSSSVPRVAFIDAGVVLAINF